MHKFVAALTGAGVAVGLLATAGSAQPPARTTIVDTVVAVSGTNIDDGANDFDILRTAVLATGADALLSGQRQLTVFAPTDEAFVALAEALDGVDAELSESETVAFLVGALGVDGIRDVLEYHVAPGARLSGDVVPAERIRTLSGGFLTKDPGSITFDQGAPNPASIIAEPGLFDIRVDNGVIHAIDAVLVP